MYVIVSTCMRNGRNFIFLTHPALAGISQMSSRLQGRKVKVPRMAWARDTGLKTSRAKIHPGLPWMPLDPSRHCLWTPGKGLGSQVRS